MATQTVQETAIIYLKKEWEVGWIKKIQAKQKPTFCWI